MTKEECWKLIIVLKSTYPKHYEKFGETEFENLCTMFNMCLEDYTYEQAALGLKAFLIKDTKGFPPVVGQIIEQIHLLQPQEYPAEMDAWNLVMRAIRNGTYNSEKEFEKLPPIVQKTIGNARYIYDEATNNDFNMDVAKGQFLANYRTMLKREQEISKLPESMRIESQKMARIGGESNGYDDNKETPEKMVLPDLRRG